MVINHNLSHYEVLGLPRTASLAEIRKAYRQNALKHHPDKDSAEDATVVFQRIVQAYEVLSSARTRLLYDAEQRNVDASLRNFVSNEAEKARVAEDLEKECIVARERLVSACKAGEIWQVMKLLRGGFPDLNTLDERGKTPLMYASEGQRTQVVSILMLYQADVTLASSDGWTPIMFAIGEGDQEVAQASCLEQILKSRADPNIKSNSGMTALQLACAYKNVVAVQTLLAHSADPNVGNDNGVTPLSLSSDGGHVDVARALLDAAALVDAPDNEGKTPLMYASALARADLIALLLAADADPRIVAVDGSSALSVAIEHVENVYLSPEQHRSMLDTASLLILAKADPGRMGASKLKMLDLAATCSRIEMVDFLVDSDCLSADVRPDSKSLLEPVR